MNLKKYFRCCAIDSDASSSFAELLMLAHGFSLVVDFWYIYKDVMTLFMLFVIYSQVKLSGDSREGTPLMLSNVGKNSSYGWSFECSFFPVAFNTCRSPIRQTLIMQENWTNKTVCFNLTPTATSE